MPSWVENLELEIKSYCSKSGDEDRDDECIVESIVETNSLTSGVEATSKLLLAGRNYYFHDLRTEESFGEDRENLDQCMSILFTHRKFK